MSRSKADIILAGILLGLCGLFYFETLSDKYRDTGIGSAYDAVFYPRILLIALALLSIGSIIRALYLRGNDTKIEIRKHVLPVSAVLAITVAYALCFEAVPFVLSSSVYGAAIALILGFRRPIPLAITSVGVPLAIWLIFKTVLSIHLP